MLLVCAHPPEASEKQAIKIHEQNGERFWFGDKAAAAAARRLCVAMRISSTAFYDASEEFYEFSSHRFVRSWFMTPAHNDMKAFVSFLFAQHDDTLIPEF